jgi:hypothetical protein
MSFRLRLWLRRVQARFARLGASVVGVGIAGVGIVFAGIGIGFAVATLEAQPLRLAVTNVAQGLVDRGLASPAPTDAVAQGFEEVPAPGIRFLPNVAHATTAPWIDSNGWRFQRGLRKAHYATLPEGSAALAAAEAFTFDVEAILNPHAADVEPLGAMLTFLKAQPQPSLPVLANIGIVDDGSAQMSEILNLLIRRNLLYQVVSGNARSLDITVRLGSRDFPQALAANPHEFAARVRAKLGDAKRLVRLYGTTSVVARLTGDGRRARLYLLSYAGLTRPQGRGLQPVRVRLLGRYQPTRVAIDSGPADAQLADVDHPGNATEFSLPPFATLAVVDLTR